MSENLYDKMIVETRHSHKTYSCSKVNLPLNISTISSQDSPDWRSQ